MRSQESLAGDGKHKKQSAIDPASRRQKDATIALPVIGPN